MKFFNQISLAIDYINDIIGKAAAWLVLLMVLTTFGIVVMRYAFNIGSIQAQESVIYMHATLFLLATATTLRQNAHVRVDIFYGNMSQKKQAIVNFSGNLFLLIPVCAFILWSSWGYVVDSWEIKETSREAGGLPGVYLIKSLIIIFSTMLILQGVAEIIKNLRTIFSRSDDSLERENNPEHAGSPEQAKNNKAKK